MQCGAKTRDGDPCKNPPVNGSKRCRMHGGKAKRGFDLPQTKHARYSKDRPTRLLLHFEEDISDPELLNLSAEIALTDAMTREVMESLENANPNDKDEVNRHFNRLITLTENRRKLVETEQKRRVAMQNMITAEGAAAMIAALLDSVKRHVSDTRALAAIAADIDRLFGQDAP